MARPGRKLDKLVKDIKKSPSGQLSEIEDLIRRVKRYRGVHPYLATLSKKMEITPGWIPTKSQLYMARRAMEREELENLPSSLD